MNRFFVLAATVALSGVLGCTTPQRRVDGGDVEDGGGQDGGGQDSGDQDGGSQDGGQDGGPDDAGQDGGLCASVDCTSLDDACNVGVCDPATGTCMAMPVVDGTTCDDGDMCSTASECTSGACVMTTPVDCSGSTDACHTATCDPATGACSVVAATDGTGCDDGIACTTGDVCTAGTCSGICSETFLATSDPVGGPGGAGTLNTGITRYRMGDFVESSRTTAFAVSRIDLDFQMSDNTAGCAVGQALSWNVSVNGVVVGSYGFAGGSGASTHRVIQGFAFAPVPAGTLTVRMEAATTVCPGGGSWGWTPGGTITTR